jgi:hypothetical protein
LNYQLISYQEIVQDDISWPARPFLISADIYTMLDDILLLGPSKNAYYFQVVPLWLSIVGKDSQLPAEGTAYKLSLHKGKI